MRKEEITHVTLLDNEGKTLKVARVNMNGDFKTQLFWRTWQAAVSFMVRSGEGDTNKLASDQGFTKEDLLDLFEVVGTLPKWGE